MKGGIKMVVEITSDNFEEEVLKSNRTVLLDFWATWCGPCRMLSPIVDEIAQEVSETVKVGKINVDEQQELAVQFGIMSIPTLVVIKNGKEEKRMVGVQPKEKIIEAIR